MKKEDFVFLYELEEDLWWFAGMREITAALLDEVCEPMSDRKILDAGCGTGGMISWLERYAQKENIFGIDTVKDALVFCRERQQKLLAQASATHLPFASLAFDLVTSFDVLVQIPGEHSDIDAMREMYRVARPGAIVFVRVAAYEWMRSGHDEALGTQRRYTLSELSGKMGDVGFEILRATYANSFLLPVAAVRRLLLKRIGLSDKGSDVKPLPENLDWLNRTLKSFLSKEAKILSRSKAKLPVGLSAICVAKKPTS
jgi:ubiquinone/menaquinone biosynthesis C-methylase UbiE